MKLFDSIAEHWHNYRATHDFLCDVCRREVFGGERICASCFKALPWNNGSVCPFCGRKVLEPGACFECKQKPLRTDLARSALLYEGEAVRLVVRFKNGERQIARAFADVGMETVQREFPRVDGFVPVPMTRGAKLRRGYNQSRLLCEEFSRRLHIPVLDVVEKRRKTTPQKSLGRTEREKNLAGCFRVKERKEIRGKALLILDDAMTTGATVSELADVLKRAGAAAVYAFTVTSVQNKRPFGWQDD